VANFDLKAINEVLEAQALEVDRSYSLRDKGLVGKVGLAWRRGAWSVGLSTTLPYWAISAKGTIRYENFALALSDSVGDPIDNVLESSLQGGRPVEWKTPWAFGAGVGWTTGAWQLHAAAEYYDAVPRHLLMESSDTVFGQSTGQPIEYSVFEEREAVLNGGIGLRWSSSDEVSIFASVVTNNSAAPDNVIPFTDLAPVVSHTSQKMDFVLYGGGVSFHTRWADLTLGATWQASKERQSRNFDFPDDSPSEAQDEGIATLKLDQWRFLIGFSIPFVDQLPGIGRGP
jgi:hypothetical protein